MLALRTLGSGFFVKGFYEFLRNTGETGCYFAGVSYTKVLFV